MSRLLVILCVIIAGVSLYPFNFQFDAVDSAGFRRFWSDATLQMGRGDLLGNFLLFIPFGGLYIFAYTSIRSWLAPFVSAVIVGALFALFLQIAQIYLPSRIESMGDVLWNSIGVAVGAAAALIIGKVERARLNVAPPLALIPALLLCSWLGYRLIPYVPSIDFQSIKTSLKPLLLTPQFESVRLLNDMAAWMVAGFMMRQVSRADRYDRFLLPLILVTILAEILIVNNVVHLSGVIGAGLAVVVWATWLSRQALAPWLLAAFLAFSLIASGLEPFALSPQPGGFSFLPFSGILGGSIFVNILSLSEKVFMLGSLLYLLQCAHIGFKIRVILAAGIAALIEIAQIFYSGHTPEITDPLLVILIAWTFKHLEERSLGASSETAAQARS